MCLRASLPALPGHRFIAGVTNPVFAQKQQWWDVMCNVGTGEVVLSDAASSAGSVVAPGLLLIPTSASGSSVGASGPAGGSAGGSDGMPRSTSVTPTGNVSRPTSEAFGAVVDLGPAQFSSVAWKTAEALYFDKVRVKRARAGWGDDDERTRSRCPLVSS